MKDKEKIFELLRAAAETPDEERYVEDLIRKVEKIMPPIEQIDEMHVKFDGRVFRDTRTGYYEMSTSLHREIWRFFHGEIPAGYEVHHKNLNHTDNNITNFELLTKSEHKKLHLNASLKKFICKVCGREFEAKSIAEKNCYCSKECRRKGSKQKYLSEYICEYCGGKFQADKNNKHRFCSQKCARTARYEKSRDIRICPICDKEFTVRKSDRNKYCSKKCSHEARSICKEVRICPICGKEFKKYPSQNYKYCSRKCAGKARRKH